MSTDYNFSHNEETGVYSSIDVDPDQLWFQRATAIELGIRDFNLGLNHLSDLWDGLQIGWMGRDSTEAQAFIDELKAALVGLFGREGQVSLTDLGPNEGSLVKIVAGIKITAQNHGWGEYHRRKLFEDFVAQINAPPKEPTGGPRADWDKGPVFEQYNP